MSGKQESVSIQLSDAARESVAKNRTQLLKLSFYVANRTFLFVGMETVALN